MEGKKVNKDFKVGHATTLREMNIVRGMEYPPEPKGRKDDSGKLMLAQFYKHFPNAYKALVDTAMYGFKKYNEDIHDPNWKKVSIEQYEDAIFRHFDKYLTGELVDKESGKKHLAHIIWNACVLYELNEVRNENT